MNRRSPTMAVRQAGLSARAAPFFPNVFAVLLGLLALMTQSLVVQTHIHYSAGSAKTGLVSVVDQAGVPISTDGNNTPAGKSGSSDESNCPLCQAFANSSQFTHSVALFSLPVLISRAIYFAAHEAVLSFEAVSHSWRGRAPPL
jgi:hypothetical protein